MGKVVGGKYHLIAHLGGGTVSDVSLARVEDGAPGAELAVVKRLKLGADAEPDLLVQFADEARLSLRLDHPNIVRALAAGEDAEGSFLVFDYLDGQTLARIRSRASRRAGGIPRPIALHIVKAIATGLAYAHAVTDEAGKPLQLVHRDVSPENVIVTYAGATKIIDFSVATAKNAASKGRAGATKGNIAYMAPEQSKSAVKLDERADVFAAGLVLWELLAGKRMWEGTSEADILARLADVDTPLPSLRSIEPDMPADLDAICVQALAKVRDDRFDSATALIEAIDKAVTTLALQTTTNEVAAFVTSLFEDEREKMRATIAEALAADSGHSLPRLPATPESTGALPAVGSEPELPPDASASQPIRVVEVVEVVRVEPPSRDRRFTLAVGGAVLIAFSLVAVVAITEGAKGGLPPEDPGVAPHSHQRLPTEPEPVMPAIEEPQMVAIEISVTPATALLTIDGAKIPSSPYRTKVVPGKYMHEVHAEAPGYEPRDLKLAFDKERTFEIALTTKQPVYVHRPSAPAPPPAPKPPVEAPADAGAP